MHKNKYILVTLLALLAQGCSTKTDTNIDKEKTLQKVNAIITQHKNDKKNAALAISIDENNKYIMGYSHDSKSEQNATKIALEHCTQQGAGKTIKSPCEIYLLNGKEIRTLK